MSQLGTTTDGRSVHDLFEAMRDDPAPTLLLLTLNSGDLSAGLSLAGAAIPALLRLLGDKFLIAGGDSRGISPASNGVHGLHGRAVDMDRWLFSGAVELARQRPEELGSRLRASWQAWNAAGGSNHSKLARDCSHLDGPASCRRVVMASSFGTNPPLGASWFDSRAVLAVSTAGDMDFHTFGKSDANKFFSQRGDAADGRGSLAVAGRDDFLAAAQASQALMEAREPRESLGRAPPRCAASPSL